MVVEETVKRFLHSKDDVFDTYENLWNFMNQVARGNFGEFPDEITLKVTKNVFKMILRSCTSDTNTENTNGEISINGNRIVFNIKLVELEKA